MYREDILLIYGDGSHLLSISGADLLIIVVVLVLLLLLLGGLHYSLLDERLRLLLKVHLELLLEGLAVLEGEFEDLLGNEWRPLGIGDSSDPELLQLELHVLVVGRLHLHELVDQGAGPAEVLVVLEQGGLQPLGPLVPVGELDKPPEGVHIGVGVLLKERDQLEVLAEDENLDEVIEEVMELRNVVAEASKGWHFKIIILLVSHDGEQALELLLVILEHLRGRIVGSATVHDHSLGILTPFHMLKHRVLVNGSVNGAPAQVCEINTVTTGELDVLHDQVQFWGFEFRVLCLQVDVVDVGGDEEGSVGLEVPLELVAALGQVTLRDLHDEFRGVADDVPRLSSNLDALLGGSRLA